MKMRYKVLKQLARLYLKKSAHNYKINTCFYNILKYILNIISHVFIQSDSTGLEMIKAECSQKSYLLATSLHEVFGRRYLICVSLSITSYLLEIVFPIDILDQES